MADLGVHDDVGIIPARAGFTTASSGSILLGQDHPRSRGVYVVASLDELYPVGSSPLARGLLTGIRTVAYSVGIIPARAGFTKLGYTYVLEDGDHPRSRGVYGGVSCVVGGLEGSSPLARGLRRGGGPPPGRRRIIPARAGFTPGDVIVSGTQTDHPRSRGVYCTMTSGAPS